MGVDGGFCYWQPTVKSCVMLQQPGRCVWGTWWDGGWWGVLLLTANRKMLCDVAAAKTVSKGGLVGVGWGLLLLTVNYRMLGEVAAARAVSKGDLVGWSLLGFFLWLTVNHGMLGDVAAPRMVLKGDLVGVGVLLFLFCYWQSMMECWMMLQWPGWCLRVTWRG